ncbi:MAG: hypothetical protein KOO60_07305 [Gemmatimonadales bacterium]|nr:hypothetical protein [Gemmatimonadales bacterium]
MSSQIRLLQDVWVLHIDDQVVGEVYSYGSSRTHKGEIDTITIVVCQQEGNFWDYWSYLDGQRRILSVVCGDETIETEGVLEMAAPDTAMFLTLSFRVFRTGENNAIET